MTRSRSRSGSRSSSSSSSSVVAEAEMEGFDFEESINSKRRELLADAALSADNEKTSVAAATASVSKSENTDDAGKKPFINGIDMFAEELHIEAESYNVGTSQTSENIVEYLYCSACQVYTVFRKKSPTYIFDYNSGISWSIFILFIPVEREINTLQFSYLQS